MREPQTDKERHVDPSMLLPLGKTCADCRSIRKCQAMFGVEGDETWCDFAPSRFSRAPTEDHHG